MKYIAIATLE